LPSTSIFHNSAIFYFAFHWQTLVSFEGIFWFHKKPDFSVILFGIKPARKHITPLYVKPNKQPKRRTKMSKKQNPLPLQNEQDLTHPVADSRVKPKNQTIPHKQGQQIRRPPN
jgi:hypothetical protein